MQNIQEFGTKPIWFINDSSVYRTDEPTTKNNI